MQRGLGGALIGFALAGCALAADPSERLELLGSYHWTGDDEHFGGFSGLEVSDDGNSFTVITDRSFITRGTFQREDGRIASVAAEPLAPLVNSKGERLEGYMSDSEGLAQAADGTLYISFEGFHRVSRLIEGENKENIVGWIDRPAEFNSFQNNSAMEALAIDPQGRPIASLERSGDWDKPFPVYRLEGDRWTQPYFIPRRGKHLLVGADVGPDNRLYIIERKFSGILGFSSRIRSFAFHGDTLTDEQLLIETPTGKFDNLESISVWRDDGGAIRLTLISDDNFFPLQRTEFVEYRLAAKSPHS
ncbi:esterase-like activity of phytase family protein [Qingshengfaniella alkalisoli]|uniref:Esterase-like activity of phytase family protein n=1 Tax=Qingshengfaniella alkalisoli TaxID=2599296 RepID=A0A5B8IV62_9RHOB|nr:esterase-like activity of phytase family protein [Qingshengfaniella alkalisoli]QDY70002.1 esterase-like activity of phytase family protein [Qingshengfaniella alkalisoli]